MFWSDNKVGLRNSPTWKQSILIAALIAVFALVFWNPHSQTTNWIYPFFSGAANLEFDLVWRVDASGYGDFASLSYGQQMNYWFEKGQAENLVRYSVLDKGYVYIVWVAKSILFWLPPMKAVIWFQIAFHIISSLWVMDRLENRRQKVLFAVSYAINPIVLHFVTFAYLYYWQVIPSLAWFWYARRVRDRENADFILLTLVLAGAFLIRQSTAIVSILILILAAWRCKKAIGWSAVVCFMIFMLFAKNPSEPWHTIYVGVGAYPNAAGVELRDDSGFKMFKEISGIQIDTTTPNGNWYDEKVRGIYYEILKDWLINYYERHPLEMVRNAVINTLESFSFGYPVGHLGLAYMSALIGLMVLIVLFALRMYEIIAVAFFSVSGFIFYYPPIPAYMFGSYFILAFAFVTVIDNMAKCGRRIALRNKNSPSMNLPNE